MPLRSARGPPSGCSSPLLAKPVGHDAEHLSAKQWRRLTAMLDDVDQHADLEDPGPEQVDVDDEVRGTRSSACLRQLLGDGCGPQDQAGAQEGPRPPGPVLGRAERESEEHQQQGHGHAAQSGCVEVEAIISTTGRQQPAQEEVREDGERHDDEEDRTPPVAA